jgi:hypothetical protein
MSHDSGPASPAHQLVHRPTVRNSRFRAEEYSEKIWCCYHCEASPRFPMFRPRNNRMYCNFYHQGVDRVCLSKAISHSSRLLINTDVGARTSRGLDRRFVPSPWERSSRRCPGFCCSLPAGSIRLQRPPYLGLAEGSPPTHGGHRSVQAIDDG